MLDEIKRRCKFNLYSANSAKPKHKPIEFNFFTYTRGFLISNCMPRPARFNASMKLFVSSRARAGVMTYQRLKSMHKNIELLRNSLCQSAFTFVFDLKKNCNFREFELTSWCDSIEWGVYSSNSILLTCYRHQTKCPGMARCEREFLPNLVSIANSTHSNGVSFPVNWPIVDWMPTTVQYVMMARFSYADSTLSLCYFEKIENGQTLSMELQWKQKCIQSENCMETGKHGDSYRKFARISSVKPVHWFKKCVVDINAQDTCCWREDFR